MLLVGVLLRGDPNTTASIERYSCTERVCWSIIGDFAGSQRKHSSRYSTSTYMALRLDDAVQQVPGTQVTARAPVNMAQRPPAAALCNPSSQSFVASAESEKGRGPRVQSRVRREASILGHCIARIAFSTEEVTECISGPKQKIQG